MENESLHGATTRATVEVVTSVDKPVESINVLVLAIMLRHIEVAIAVVERGQHVQLLGLCKVWSLVVWVELPRRCLKWCIFGLGSDLGIACIRVIQCS